MISSAMVDQNIIRDAAVALNNTAVTLLSRSRYSESTEIFQDALQLMKAALPGNRAQQTKISDLDVNKCLQRASRRLARSSFAHILARQHSQDRFKILSDDLGVKSALDVVQKSQFEDSTAIMIRIHACNESASNLDLECATIIYNYGLAARCLHEEKLAAHLQGSLRLFNLSFQIISHIFIGEEEKDCEGTVLFYLVSTLLLQNMIQVCFQLGMHEKCQQLRALHNDIAQEEPYCPSDTDNLSAPAA